MGKKQVKGGYNDFLDGEKLRDNAEIRTSLQAQGANRSISPPPTRQERKGKGKRGKGGPPKPQPTHFLCLPLVDETTRPQLQESLTNLAQEVDRSGVVPTKAIRPVGTLHLTLGVMSMTPDQLANAIQHLRTLDLSALLRDVSAQLVAEEAARDGLVAENLNAAALPDSTALSIELKGLVPMQRPAQTSVLYAEPVDGGRLFAFAKELRRAFVDEGLVVEEGRALKLHATLVNTVYAKPKGRSGRTRALSGRDKGLVMKGSVDGVLDGVEQDEAGTSSGEEAGDGAGVEPERSEGVATEGHGSKAKGWRNFDARELMERFKEAVWARDVRIDRVQICKMGAKKVLGADGEVVDEEYEVVAEKVIATGSTHGAVVDASET